MHTRPKDSQFSLRKGMSALLALSLCLAVSCKSSSGGSRSGDGAATTTTTDPGGTGTADSLEFSTLPSELYTSASADNSCVTFRVVTKAAGATVADVGVIFSIVASSAMGEQKGTITPESGVSSSEGVLEASYCSGTAEGTVAITAKAGAISANSSQMTIKTKPTYTFAYSSSDTPTATGEDGQAANYLVLNTIDSGPQDCTFLYFKLLRSSEPVVGANVTFTTQTDYPKGVKLSRRADALTTVTDDVNGKKKASFAGVSSSSGEFAVPICTGSSLGSVTVTGIYTDPEQGKILVAAAPVIRITSGVTSYINYSLSFDPINARTLRAFYNTNSEYDLAFTVQTGARADGLSIKDYPITIGTEVGRFNVENGGYPDETTGEIAVKLHALHLVDNYPFPVVKFWKDQNLGTVYSGAQTRCEPNEIAAWVRAINGGTAMNYKVLKKNWQSTVVYAIRGQEYFHDANRNGVYDVGGMGFWDKNQNGIFDGNDVITYPAGATTFDPTGEWFIDMPTPFIDGDDDLLTTTTGYNSSNDTLLGDEYVAPNGKRDSDTIIWKSEVFPISMGPSFYSMANPSIKDDGAGVLAEADEVYSGSGTATVADNVHIFGLGSISESKLWDASADYSTIGDYKFVVFLQDLCGNLLPGGTKLSFDFEETYNSKYGTRSRLALLSPPAIDYTLEPTRQLLKDYGGGQATINFNASNHPSANENYPLSGVIEVSACSEPCTGLVVTPGVACDSWSGYVRMTVEGIKLDQHTETITRRVRYSYPAVKTCDCKNKPNIIFDAGVCKCSEGTSYDTATDACKAT